MSGCLRAGSGQCGSWRAPPGPSRCHWPACRAPTQPQLISASDTERQPSPLCPPLLLSSPSHPASSTRHGLSLHTPGACLVLVAPHKLPLFPPPELFLPLPKPPCQLTMLPLQAQLRTPLRQEAHPSPPSPGSLHYQDIPAVCPLRSGQGALRAETGSRHIPTPGAGCGTRRTLNLPSHVFIKHMLSTCRVPGLVLGAGAVVLVS